MSQTAAASRSASPGPTTPGYEPRPAIAPRRDIHTRRTPGPGTTLTARHSRTRRTAVMRDTAPNAIQLIDQARRPGELHVVEAGSPTAPPILLIHGTAGSLVWWDPIVPALAAHYHVVRVDLAGHGQSPPAPSYDVGTQANRVSAVLDRLGAGTATVVGHSSGGFVATALAERRPDIMPGLVLINTETATAP